MHEEAQPRQIVAESPDPCSATRIILSQILVLLWADFSGTRSLSLLGLLGGGRADFSGKRSLSLLGLLGGGRADFAGKRSLSLPGLLGLLGLLGGGRVDFAGKRSLSLLGLLGGLFREAFTESAGSAASGPFRVS